MDSDNYEFEDFEDNMCNMSDIDEANYDTKSVASTIDDFIERTPTNHIMGFREKIDEMRNSKWVQVVLILFILSLAYSLFYWDDTKQILYSYFTGFQSTLKFFRLISET